MNTPYRPSNQGNIFKYGTKSFRGYYSCDAWTGKVTFSKLQSPTKVLARLPTFAVSVREIYQFAPLPPIQCYLSWCIRHCSFPTLSGGGGGEGFFIPVMSLVIASKYLVNACSSYLIQTCQRLLSWIVPETNWRERHCVCFDFVSCQRCFMPFQPSFLLGETFVSFFLVRAFIQF